MKITYNLSVVGKELYCDRTTGYVPQQNTVILINGTMYSITQIIYIAQETQVDIFLKPYYKDL